jgi:hypothetical protein
MKKGRAAGGSNNRDEMRDQRKETRKGRRRRMCGKKRTHWQ